MDEPLILSLDGSTGNCSAALLVPGHPVGGRETWTVATSRSEGDGRAQARVLLRLVDDMLREVGSEPGCLSGVVVGSGPGTFTGVRITVATARALALSLKIPVLGISTLAGLAARAADANPEAGVVVSVVDARRGQLFYGVYSRAHDLPGRTPRWERRLPLSVCDTGDLMMRLDELVGVDSANTADCATDRARMGSMVIVGDPGLGLPIPACHARLLQAEMAAEWLLRGQESLVEPGSIPAGDRLDPWIRLMCSRGAQAWRSGPSASSPGEPGTPESVKPIYVRSPDADIHITKMRDPWAVGPGAG